MKRLLIVCVLLFAAVMYAQEKSQVPPKGAHTAAQHAAKPTDFKAEVQKNADEWKAAFKAKDADKVASLYTDDAVFINPEGSFHGSADIKAELKKMIDRGDTVDAITTTKAVHSGDLGYAEGTYTGKVSTGRGGEETHGVWVVTLKRINNKWLLASHTSVRGATGADKAVTKSK